MSAPPQWSYVQARLQARHGERLTEEGWQAVEAARSFEEFLDRARSGGLGRFTERLNAQMTVHALEATLRSESRAYVQALAGWVPPEWRAAVLWTMVWPDLPLIAAALEGRAPEWLGRDAFFAGLGEEAPTAGHALEPLVGAASPGLAGRWFAHWRGLWSAGADRKALEDLVALVAAHFADLDRASPQDSSLVTRHALDRALTRRFRRSGAGPVALFCHLLLVAGDLERLRGGLARRRLFAPMAVAA